ncbi:MAG TPA: hypothetical protein VGO78_17355 [Acidimicrobiales bacterium]|nr:hypothetical protein [Acidimicrobiales bacterium]
MSMVSRLGAARGVVDHGWASYEGTNGAAAAARRALIDRAVTAAFPRAGSALTESDVTVLTAEVASARLNHSALLQLRREEAARHDGDPSATNHMSVWGAAVAALQAGDWVKLLDRLLVSIRRYQLVDGSGAGPAARRRAAQRFARRCAGELGIDTPEVRWIRPVSLGGDLVTLGDIVGCAPTDDPSVIFVRADIRTDRDRLRVVAHEVAHHSGADEAEALAYEVAAVRRHVPHLPSHLKRDDVDQLERIAR